MAGRHESDGVTKYIALTSTAYHAPHCTGPHLGWDRPCCQTRPSRNMSKHVSLMAPLFVLMSQLFPLLFSGEAVRGVTTNFALPGTTYHTPPYIGLHLGWDTTRCKQPHNRSLAKQKNQITHFLLLLSDSLPRLSVAHPVRGVTSNCALPGTTYHTPPYI